MFIQNLEIFVELSEFQTILTNLQRTEAYIKKDIT
jgi:hypothetical protein